MTILTDTQAIILSNAAQRPEGLALPFPANLKGGAIKIVAAAMIKVGLLEEVDAKRGEPVYREIGEGLPVTLVITDAGLRAIGIEPAVESADGPETEEQSFADEIAEMDAREPTLAEVIGPAPMTLPTKESAPAAAAAPAERKTREGTKQALMIEMLRRPEGATVDEIAAATGWQRHTIRGAFAGALKMKLGLTITNEKLEGRGRVYRILTEPLRRNGPLAIEI